MKNETVIPMEVGEDSINKNSNNGNCNSNTLFRSCAFLISIVIIILVIAFCFMRTSTSTTSTTERIARRVTITNEMLSPIRSKFALVTVGCGSQLQTFENEKYQTLLGSRDRAVLIPCNPALRDIDSQDESVYYLQWIVDHYDSLFSNGTETEYVIFGHAHETSWHYKRPLFDTVKEFIGSKQWTIGMYGSLYCVINLKWAPTHAESVLHISFAQVWNELFANTSLEGKYSPHLRYPCCGTFWLHKSLLRTRAKKEYQQMIENIFHFNRRYPMANKKRITGRAFEGAWHVIFTNLYQIPDPCKK